MREEKGRKEEWVGCFFFGLALLCFAFGCFVRPLVQCVWAVVLCCSEGVRSRSAIYHS